MKQRNVFQALTLWLVAAILLQTDGPLTSGPLDVALVLSAVAILYVLPFYLRVRVFMSIFDIEPGSQY